jgi:uncharacterized membrane protein YidH (DUF202 family)
MNLKEKILAIAIAIIFVMFIAYGMNTFLEEPEEQDFCKDIPYEVEVEECDVAEMDMKVPRPYYGDEFEEDYCWERKFNCDEKGENCESRYYENNPAYKECRDAYEDARNNYDMMLFIIAGIIGISIIILSVFLKLESVGSGLMGGGVLTIIYGTIRYWGRMEDYIRFIVLGVVLFVLIWLGYKKLNENRKKVK